MNINRHVAQVMDEVIAWRRHLHQYPELSFQEYETTEFIEARLREMGVQTQRPTPTGVVGVIEGLRPVGERDRSSGAGAAASVVKTIAVRADIDALPIVEENDLPYKSTRDGVMHACGHDGHTAILLGVAKVLMACRDWFAGRVKLLFQPAEELPPGGAKQFIEAGVLAGVSAVVGLHLMSHIPTGKAGTRAGPLMANTDRFRIEIEGRAGHGARPHQAADAAVMAAQVILNLQAIVSRKIDPRQPAVITVGRVEAGTAFNVIPGSAVLLGTARSLSDPVREQLRAEIIDVAQQTCRVLGGTAQVDYEFGYPALVNDARIVDVLRRAAASILGDENVFEHEPTMGGEDFAWYAREVPAAFLFLGAGNAEIGADFPHHSPRFNIDERSLAHGVAILATAALELLRN